MAEDAVDAITFLHLTENANGVSRFSDGAVPLHPVAFAPPAPPMPISEIAPATGLLFLILPAGWGGARHPSPRRQVAFCLSGRLRVEAGDGAVREFGAGAIWRMEDVSGPGHTTTVVGDEDVRLALVQLPPQPGDAITEDAP
ncbi:cupin [Palleronia sp. KMU-117]|uniref:cupin n=1 Tax=Palleronia sp. KMU-117 TaxID=3434108 RepID=UPI003D751435